MKEYAEEFYSSTAWKKCRAAYLEKVGGLCERCMSQGRYTPAELVHHIVPITPANINDPSITMNFDNLKAVCRSCHAIEHLRQNGNSNLPRYIVDELGKVTIIGD